MQKQRILILSEGFGTGHTQAANALAANIRMANLNVQVRVFELGSFLNPTVGRWILNAYKRTVSKQPKIVGMIYRYRYKKSMNRLTQLALHRLFYTRTAAMIRQLRPSAIICTHPFPNNIVARLKRLGLDMPLGTVITDYDVHGTWVNPEVDLYMVSTDEVQRRLLAKGIPSSQIQVTGIPVHPDFWKPQNREELLRQLQLRNLPTVMVMGGGWGIMDNEDLYEELLSWRNKIQIVICLGKNQSVLEKLSRNPLYKHPNVRLLGFTKEISKWMEVSDLLITKPGGMTCSEAYVKQLPMLFLSPLPGQEQENCNYFSSIGLGKQLNSNDMLRDVLQTLCTDTATFTQQRKVNLERLRSEQQQQFGRILSTLFEAKGANLA